LHINTSKSHWETSVQITIVEWSDMEGSDMIPPTLETAEISCVINEMRWRYLSKVRQLVLKAVLCQLESNA